MESTSYEAQFWVEIKYQRRSFFFAVGSVWGPVQDEPGGIELQLEASGETQGCSGTAVYIGIAELMPPAHCI